MTCPKAAGSKNRRKGRGLCRSLPPAPMAAGSFPLLALRKNCLTGTFSEASRFGRGRFRRGGGATLGEAFAPFFSFYQVLNTEYYILPNTHSRPMVPAIKDQDCHFRRQNQRFIVILHTRSPLRRSRHRQPRQFTFATFSVQPTE